MSFQAHAILQNVLTGTSSKKPSVAAPHTMLVIACTLYSSCRFVTSAATACASQHPALGYYTMYGEELHGTCLFISRG